MLGRNLHFTVYLLVAFTFYTIHMYIDLNNNNEKCKKRKWEMFAVKIYLSNTDHSGTRQKELLC